MEGWFSIYAHSCRFWSILVDLRANIDAIAVGNPLDYIGWQGPLAFGHTYLPEVLLVGLYPVAQGPWVNPGILG